MVNDPHLKKKADRIGQPLLLVLLALNVCLHQFF